MLRAVTQRTGVNCSAWPLKVEKPENKGSWAPNSCARSFCSMLGGSHSEKLTPPTPSNKAGGRSHQEPHHHTGWGESWSPSSSSWCESHAPHPIHLSEMGGASRGTGDMGACPSILDWVLTTPAYDHHLHRHTSTCTAWLPCGPAFHYALP